MLRARDATKKFALFGTGSRFCGGPAKRLSLKQHVDQNIDVKKAERGVSYAFPTAHQPSVLCPKHSEALLRSSSRGV